MDHEGDVTISDQTGPRAGCARPEAAQAEALTTVVATGARGTLVDGDLVAAKDGVEVTFRPRGDR